jgi:hypothetical protein
MFVRESEKAIKNVRLNSISSICMQGLLLTLLMVPVYSGRSIYASPRSSSNLLSHTSPLVQTSKKPHDLPMCENCAVASSKKLENGTYVCSKEDLQD